MKITIAMVRGADKEFTLTVIKDGGDPDRSEDRENLTGATMFVHVKKNLADDDPPLFTLSTGSGITHQPQTGDTVGKADVKIASANTVSRDPDTYVMDGWVVRTNGDKKSIFKNADLVVGEAVAVP